MRAIIFGCGYLGTEAAKLLLAQGVEVFAFRRSSEALQKLQLLGVHPIQGDITQVADFAQLSSGYDWVINVTATGGGDAGAYQAVYVEGNRNILAWATKFPPSKLIYTSSTSVYGQDDGSMVDEKSVTEPLAETGKILRQSEKIVCEAAPEIPTVVLRLAGIYGPGRGYYLKRFLAGEPLAAADAGRISNLIHVNDAAHAIIQAIPFGKPGQIYNICDDQPCSLGEMFEWFAAKTNSPHPGVAATAVASSRKRGASNKRVSNRKARSELNWGLKYPTYKEGFAAELKLSAL